ncbi:MAG: hypothetical protein ACOCXQ_01255 [Patescibacteria group bacterium]
MQKKKLLSLLLVVIITIGIISALFFTGVLNWSDIAPGSRAFTNTDTRTDTCSVVQITTTESPSCPDIQPGDGKTNNIAEYSNTFTITNTKNEPIQVSYRKMGFWCKEPYTANADPQSVVCVEFGDVRIETVTIPANGTHVVTVTTPTQTTKVCGRYQNDIQIVSVNGDTTCKTPEVAGQVSGWGLCKTGIECPGEEVCSAIEVSYTDASGQQQTTISSNFEKVVQAQSGTEVKINRLQTVAGGFTQTGFVVPYNVSCLLGANPTCTSESLVEAARNANAAKPIPFTYTLPTEANTTIQFNGSIMGGEDAYRGNRVCSVRVQTVGQPTQPTKPPQEPTTPQEQPKACGATQCDPSQTNACASGLECIQANNGTYVCAKPEHQQRCAENPSTQNCCNPPAEQPPSMTISDRKNVCVEADNTIEVKGSPGTYSGVTFQVWAKNKDNTAFSAADCITDTVQGSRCLLGSSSNISFTINTKNLPNGQYIVYTQVVDQGQTVLCTNDTDSGLDVPTCSRSCL